MHSPDTAAPTASQTIVASSVFLDLVGFSKLPTTAQVQAKGRFNTILRDGLDALGSPRYWVRDLGDGALIICPHSPEHALFVALKVQHAFNALTVAPGEPALALRIGLNLGALKTNPDLEGRPNYLGDGINATQRVMDFAQPGQILASRAFVDAIAFLHADYAAMFVAPQARQDKHGRTHEVFAVEPAASTLARLYAELAAQPAAALAPAAASTPAVAPVGALEQAVTIIRNWFIPFNALLFTVGLVWAGFQRFGLSGVAAEAFGVTLGLVGAAMWWLGRRKAGPYTALGGLLLALGGLVGLTGWVAPGGVPSAGAQAPAQATASAPATAPAPSAHASALLPPQAVSAAAPPAAAASAPPPPTKTLASRTPPRETPLPAAPRPAKLAPAAEPSGADRARCTVLLNKSALGEVISAAEKQELMQSCR